MSPRAVKTAKVTPDGYTPESIGVDAFLWGCRSGIQKAVRRGDAALARLCFDALWEDKLARQWLKWRLAILVVEETFQLVGELAEFSSKLNRRNLSQSAEKIAYWKFIHLITCASKSKDAGALSILGVMAHEESYQPIVEHSEMAVATELRGLIEERSLEMALTWLLGHLDSNPIFKKLTRYERAAVDLLSSRALSGGMWGDRKMCVVAIALVALRGLPKKQIQKSVSALDLPRVEPAESLPWYVFDMHTRPGKMAVSAFLKNYGQNYGIKLLDQLYNVWFFLESGLVPLSLFPLPDDQTAPTCFDNRWWLDLMKTSLTFSDYTPVELRELWGSELRDKIHSLVHWALSKR